MPQPDPKERPMNIWGTGIFENDEAADYLDGLVDGLISEADEIVRNSKRAALDQEGETAFMPLAGIILTLCDHLGAAPPEPKTAAEWKDRYLQIFDEQIDEYVPDEDFQTARRAEVEETLSELLRLAKEYEEGVEE